jgi:hypothetical protein
MENERVELTPEEVSFVATLQLQLQTALQLMIRQRKLGGQWALGDGYMERVV